MPCIIHLVRVPKWAVEKFIKLPTLGVLISKELFCSHELKKLKMVKGKEVMIGVPRFEWCDRSCLKCFLWY